MGKIVYKTTERGDLQKVSNGKVFGVKSARITKGRRGQVVDLELATGKHKRVFRWQVDEGAHSFGPQITEEAPAKKRGAEKGSKVKRAYHRRALVTSEQKAVVPRPKPAPRFELLNGVLYMIREVGLTPEQLEALFPRQEKP